MKAIRITLTLLSLLYVLAGCNLPKEYHKTFKGNSQNWSAELIQDGNVTYRDHPELEDQYEIDYEKNETLKLYYIGEESSLGQSVEYKYYSGSGATKASKDEEIGVTEVFTHSGGTSGTTHIPKDYNYEPVDSDERVFEITVIWNGKEEKIQLKHVE